MSHPATASEIAPRPLTSLNDEEQLFRQSVREFANQQVRPVAPEMDEHGKFSADLIKQFFELGLMGISIPEEYGGQGGSFFNSILAVEELSRADASAGVVVDVQNTLVNNAILTWASEEQKRRYCPRLATDMVGAYALSEAGSGSDAFALATKARRRNIGHADKKHPHQRVKAFIIVARGGRISESGRERDHDRQCNPRCNTAGPTPSFQPADGIAI